MRLVGLLAIAALFGCGGDAPPSDDDGPIAPVGCVPGERTLDNGTCQPAGVPPDRCASGFSSDGLGGCVPVLPAAPCPDGEIAVPGDSVCRPIADCGSGTWGNIDRSGAVLHVDASAAAGGDGSETAPYNRIADAISAAAANTTVAIAAGDYLESLTISTPIALWGRCPSMVSIRSPGVYALRFTANASVRGVAVTGGHGIAVYNAQATLSDLFLHDLTAVAIWVEAQTLDTAATISNVDIRRVVDTGVLALGASIVAEGIHVSDVAPTVVPAFGRGVDVEHIGSRRGALELRTSVVERVREHGIYVSGSDALIDGVLVRDVTFGTTIDPGRGIHVKTNAVGEVGNLTLVGSVIERTIDTGVWCDGTASIATTTVRDTLPNEARQFGYGISFFRGTSFSVSESLVERATALGIANFGAAVTIDSVLIRDTQPDAELGFFGRGINGQPSPGLPLLTIRWSTILSSYDSAVSIFNGTANIEATLIDTVRVNAVDQTFGDGVDVMGGVPAGTLTLVGSEIRNAVRAAIGNFGSRATVANNALLCNGLDLNGENLTDDFVFEDLGGNRCGCEEDLDCKVVSTALAPPSAPPIQDQ